MFCIVRGVSLPQLGSFEYFLLSEQLRREREEKVAHARLMATIAGRGAGLEQNEIDELVEEYAEAVYQLKYNSKYRSALSRKWEAKIAERSMEMDLLEKVSQMTV